MPFFEQALSFEHQSGIPVGHEPHRSRAFFTPWSTAKLLAKFPELWVLLISIIGSVYANLGFRIRQNILLSLPKDQSIFTAGSGTLKDRILPLRNIKENWKFINRFGTRFMQNESRKVRRTSLLQLSLVRPVICIHFLLQNNQSLICETSVCG